jgi:transposase InsO family protein
VSGIGWAEDETIAKLPITPVGGEFVISANLREPGSLAHADDHGTVRSVRELLILAVHLLVTFAKFLRPGGVRAVAAESLLLKHQLLISNRSRQRAPNLTAVDRFILGFATLFVRPDRLRKLGALVKPATLLQFHKALVARKYRRLFSSISSPRRKPGPKGPSAELITAIIELKRRNPRFGCVRIAQQIAHAFGVAIDKDVVRRVLARHYRPDDAGSTSPSWLTFLAGAKDSLWSVDLFRCESILLRSHWVLVVLDVFTRRLVGFGVKSAPIDGVSVCRMFNHAVAGQQTPRRVSTDHDPLFRFHRWLANLRVREIGEVKTVPHAPVSHPFVERLIGTLRREYLDHVFFWNVRDLARKLEEFKIYYNAARVHRGIAGITPAERAGRLRPISATLTRYTWQQHCHGIFQIPIAA